jgi:hypothetical protein
MAQLSGKVSDNLLKICTAIGLCELCALLFNPCVDCVEAASCSSGFIHGSF